MLRFIALMAFAYLVGLGVHTFDEHEYVSDTGTDRPDLNAQFLKEQQDAQAYIDSVHSQIPDTLVVYGMPHLLDSAAIVFISGDTLHSLFIARDSATGTMRVVNGDVGLNLQQFWRIK